MHLLFVEIDLQSRVPSCVEQRFTPSLLSHILLESQFKCHTITLNLTQQAVHTGPAEKKMTPVSCTESSKSKCSLIKLPRQHRLKSSIWFVFKFISNSSTDRLHIAKLRFKFSNWLIKKLFQSTGQNGCALQAPLQVQYLVR